MIRDLAIYGAGGFGREMGLMIEQMNAHNNQWRLVGFFDDGKQANEKIDGIPVLGGIESLNEWQSSLGVVVAVADPVLRRVVVEKIRNVRIEFPVMIHPQSMAGSLNNKFGRGTLITAGSILTTGVEIQDFVIVNLGCTIGHDVKIGSYTSVMPGCNISGGVTIGEGNLIGTGAQIVQYLKVGDNCKIGAGAVVIGSVENGKTVVGVPARANSLK